jgi:hypothetical protein
VTVSAIAASVGRPPDGALASSSLAPLRLDGTGALLVVELQLGLGYTATRAGAALAVLDPKVTA